MVQPFNPTHWFYALCFLVVVIIICSYLLRRRQIKRQRQAESVALLRERLHRLEQHACLLEQENQELRRLSELDGLTGIANRRHFESVFDREWRRACRAG